jgi:N-acetylglucosamine kinase-like BadF-type ATPase
VTTRAAVLAVDGGNSKVELLFVAADGQILGYRRAETISHQQIGLEAGMDRLVRLARDCAQEAGIGDGGSGDGGANERNVALAEVGAFCLAGADFPAEMRRLRGALEATGLVDRVVVENDTLAVLRAGASRRWGVGIVCGQGINGVAVGADGRIARFDAVGDISGDWGGATSVGQAALAAAARATDGRGAGTALTRLVPAHFGRRTVAALVRDLYYGRVNADRLADLSPLVFEAATDGDAVARGIVDRLADELLVMIQALVRRTRLGRREPEVVLAGGVFRNRDEAFYRRLEAGIEAAAPGARMVRLAAPPVIGAALIGLDALGLPSHVSGPAESRLRAEGAQLG